MFSTQCTSILYIHTRYTETQKVRWCANECALFYFLLSLFWENTLGYMFWLGSWLAHGGIYGAAQGGEND